jgi:hypothetical protein
MKGSMAAALGFMTAAKPNKIICDWMDSELTSGNILFLVFAVTVTTNLFGFGHRYGVWKYERCHILDGRWFVGIWSLWVPPQLL